MCMILFFFFSSRRRHTRCLSDWSSDVCSSDLGDAESRRKTRRGGRERVKGGPGFARSPGCGVSGEREKRSELRSDWQAKACPTKGRDASELSTVRIRIPG